MVSRDHDDSHLADLLDSDIWFALVEPFHIQRVITHEDASQMLLKPSGAHFSSIRPSPSLPFLTPRPEVTCTLAVETVKRFSGEISRVRDELDRAASGVQVIAAVTTMGSDGWPSSWRATDRPAEGRLHLSVCDLAEGFRSVPANVVTLSDDELFDRQLHRRAATSQVPEQGHLQLHIQLLACQHCRLHLSQCIAIHRGLKLPQKNEQFEEHLTLQFADKSSSMSPPARWTSFRNTLAWTPAPRLSNAIPANAAKTGSAGRA